MAEPLCLRRVSDAHLYDLHASPVVYTNKYSLSRERMTNAFGVPVNAEMSGHSLATHQDLKIALQKSETSSWY